ncbi:MAG: putative nuclease of putative toxin-antitoxin system, partial [Patiriisocius sp.]
MKVLLDMNLSPRWLSTLADEGIDGVHWSQVGGPCAPDSLLASYALSNGLIVLTQD